MKTSSEDFDNFKSNFIPQINEKSRQIAETLRTNSILSLFEIISNGSDIVDLMTFQGSSVRTQTELTQHHILAVQYFIPYAIKKAKKLEPNEIPNNNEQMIEFIKNKYNKDPILIDFDEKVHLFLTKDAFLETMKIYLQLPHSKKFPIPIKFDKNINNRNNNKPSVKKNKNIINSKDSKQPTIGPQMEKAINNYLKKKLSKKNNLENNDISLEKDPECTFHPKLQKTLYNKYKKQLGINSITKNDECMNILRKYLLLDNNDKDKEIESYFKSLQECTFQPNIDKFIKKGIPDEFYSKIKEKEENDLNSTFIEENKLLFTNNLNQEQDENQTEFEKIQNERERIIEKIIEQEWNKAFDKLFKNESNNKISNLIPIYESEEYQESKNSNSNINKKNQELIEYKWQTREQGPIYDRNIRQKFNLKKISNDQVETDKIKIQSNQPKKKYIPPYKWEEDLRSEDQKYQTNIINKNHKNNDIKLYDQIRWERYIRLKDRHVKSVPVSNIQIINNTEKELNNQLELSEIITPITVVGIRENIINYLETELEKPLPNLLELFNH